MFPSYGHWHFPYLGHWLRAHKRPVVVRSHYLPLLGTFNAIPFPHWHFPYLGNWLRAHKRPVVVRSHYLPLLGTSVFLRLYVYRSASNQRRAFCFALFRPSCCSYGVRCFPLTGIGTFPTSATGYVCTNVPSLLDHVAIPPPICIPFRIESKASVLFRIVPTVVL